MMTETSTNNRKTARLCLAFELFEAGLEIMRQNLKRRYPGCGVNEIERMLEEWLLERDGAPHGDVSGRIFKPAKLKK
ncbi:MAG: hypothetical protein QNJ97_09980 [Myxococcota bacterium]|nr:hypothetical protein [Myxococcota bacterium]